MLSESRIDIYEYLKGIFYDVVTKNYYEMDEPEENTDSDNNDGFIVVKVGNVVDFSEFRLSAYAESRCFVYAFVPKLKRGRLNKSLYKSFEDAINEAIRNAADDNTKDYFIMPDTIISTDDLEDSQKGNQYNMFVKSFIVATNDIGNNNSNNN